MDLLLLSFRVCSYHEWQWNMPVECTGACQLALLHVMSDAIDILLLATKTGNGIVACNFIGVGPTMHQVSCNFSSLYLQI